METKRTYSIREAADSLNSTVATIRHFCNQGLIPHVYRDQHHRRILEAHQVELARILLGMKQAGFRPKEIRQYSRLYRHGASTEAERLAMLTTRKRQLWHEIEARQKAIDFIERQEEIIHDAK